MSSSLTPPPKVTIEQFDAYERAAWPSRASTYRDGFAQLTGHTVGPLLDAAGVRAGTRVLDVGCGPGVVTGVALARGANVVAADATPEMLDLVRAAHPGVEAHHAILPDLPFPDESFDAVVGNFVINHVGDTAAALAQIARVLRPGGLVALSCWDKPNMYATGVFDEALEARGAVRPAELPSSGRFLAGAPDLATGFAALVAGAGLLEPQVLEVRWRHDVDADAWWHAVIRGTPMTGAVISGQDPDMLESIRLAYLELTAPYRRPDGLVGLPAAALVAVGRRPGP